MRGRHPQPSGPRPAPRTWIGHALGFGASFGVHGLALWLTAWSATTSGLDVDLQLPSEVEFGLGEQVELSAAPPAPEPPAPEAGGAGAAEAEADQGEGAGPDAGPGEAEAPDAGVAPTDAGTADAGPLLAQAGDAGAAQPSLAEQRAEQSTLPSGAHLGLRLHMGRLRESPLAPRIRELLDIIHDWRQVLDGSGVEPMDDLERVFIAHPGKGTRGRLDPSRWIVAGEHRHDAQFVRERVERIAKVHGKALSEDAWRAQRKGPLRIPVAPWHDASGTSRVVALLGKRQFAIAREQDLAPLLAVALARNEEVRGDAPPPGGEPQALAEGLLSMAPEALLSIEGHGLHQFTAGLPPSRQRLAPTDAHVLVRPLDDGGYEIRGTARYPSADAAKEARDEWQRRADRLRKSPAALLMVELGLGFAPGPLLEALELEVEGPRLEARTRVGESAADGLLTLVFRIVRGKVDPADLAEEAAGAAQP